MNDSSISPAGDGTPVETLAGFSEWVEIGRGGDATVYRAVQDALHREVAIKVLTLDDEESIGRFTREVQLMVSLGRQHPNIVKVLQIGTSSRGRPCIVMDYYELGSLDQQLARYGPLSPQETIQVGIVVADALAFAHAQGVLHRDVKPQNILILPTSYVLTDFGIARLTDAAHIASTERFSYRHASPQVLDGHPPAATDDIFSLGATLFHLVDGRPPFTRTDDETDSALDYIERVRGGVPRPLGAEVPAALRRIIDRALHRDPGERFPSADAMRDELAAARLGLGSSETRPRPGIARSTARPIGPEPSDPRWEQERHESVTFRPAPELMPSRPPRVGTGSWMTPPPPSEAELTQAPPRPRERAKVPQSAVFIAVATIAAIVTVLLWGPLGSLRGEDAASAPAGNRSQQVRQNPALAPTQVDIVVEGDRAEATWTEAPAPPDTWAWGVGATEDEAGRNIVGNTTRILDRRADLVLDPSWSQVCVAVFGLRNPGAEVGLYARCVPR